MTEYERESKLKKYKIKKGRVGLYLKSIGDF